MRQHLRPAVLCELGPERSGVGLVDGKMTDEVHVRWARQVLQRGERRTEDR